MKTFVKLFAISSVFLILGSLLIFYIETGSNESEINSITDAIWWTVATVTTVGYGDVVPVSEIGRIVGIVYMFFGIAILGLFIAEIRNSIIKGGIGQEYLNTQNMQRIEDRINKIEAHQQDILSKLDVIIDKSKVSSEKKP